MRKQELYTNAGWINAELLVDCKEPFVLAVGGRGIGKSYGILKTIYERQIPFIYMRRTQSQLDAVTVPQLNPYNQIATDNGYNIVTAKISKHTTGFYNGEPTDDGILKPVGEPFALGIALSTFSNVRGLSAEKYKILFFDEIIPEKHERPIKEEGLAFANVVESINRNRELQGLEPIKVILATNTNTLNSEIIKTLGCLNVLDKMARSNQFYKSVNGLIAIYRYIDSPISEKKRNSALYKVIENDDFQTMSIENDFGAGDYENVQNKPIAEYNALCSFENCTVMKHKSKPEYYVVDGIKCNNERYQNLPLSKKAFNRKYFYVYGAIMDKRVFYQNASVKIEIEGAFK